MDALKLTMNPASSARTSQAAFDLDRQEFQHAGFFMLRTSLASIESFLTWTAVGASSQTLDDQAKEPRPLKAISADVPRLADRLLEMFAGGELREALYHSSPSLERAISSVLGRGARPDRKTLRKLVLYFLRACSRPTPFGLFAAYSLGTIGSTTSVSFPPVSRWTRRTSLDRGLLGAIVGRVAATPDIREAINYVPSATLNRFGGHWHYLKRSPGTSYESAVVAIDDTPYLSAAVACSRSGRRLVDIEAAVLAAGNGCAPDEAAEFVTELVREGILVPDLFPPVTGADPLDHVCAALNTVPGAEAPARLLSDVRRELRELDALPIGAGMAASKAVMAKVTALTDAVPDQTAFHSTVYAVSPDLTLGSDVVDELVRGMAIVHRMWDPPRSGALKAFREQFEARYGDAEVPLLEVMDEDTGIRLEPERPRDQADHPESTLAWGERERWLWSRALDVEQRKLRSLELSEEDLSHLAVATPLRLPDSLHVMATVLAGRENNPSGNGFSILFRHCLGPPGARLFGRFCQHDPELRTRVLASLRTEEDLQPEAVFAEIVYSPEPEAENVISRPVLRDYEIPVFSKSGAPLENQIDLEDLRVSLVEGRIVLRSERLNREVIPRLTNAHAYNSPILPTAYRFLCAVQDQLTSVGPRWLWGGLASQPYLPRVTYKRLILSRARWLLLQTEFQHLTSLNLPELCQAILRWRHARGIPRYVNLLDGDAELLFDLANPLCIDAFLSVVSRNLQLELLELYPEPDEFWRLGGGHRVHEVVVPFVRSSRYAVARPRTVESRGWLHHRFPPGTDWLYVKLYGGRSAADRLLLDVVAPLVERLQERSVINRWFFVRYADPHGHLRLRFRCGHPSNAMAVLDALNGPLAAALESGAVYRIELDTYVREVARYGGEAGIVFAEGVFHADSEAVLGLLALARREPDLRQRLTVVSADRLFSDLGLDQSEKSVVILQLRRQYDTASRADRLQRKELGNAFRAQRHAIARLMTPSPGEPNPIDDILRSRSLAIGRLRSDLGSSGDLARLKEPLSTIAGSFVHMHINRMLKAATPLRELEVYDLLARLYDAAKYSVNSESLHGA